MEMPVEMPKGGLEAAVEIGRIATAPGSAQERATALLKPLHRLVPFQAARIFLLDLSRREQIPLISHGYDQAVCAYLNSPAIVDEIELLGLHRRGAPIRVQDLPVPPAQVRVWTEYLRPAGFREGLGTGLFTPDGRYLGVLGLNTDSTAHPTAAARDLIGVLAPVIANAVDPLRSLTTAARIVGDAWAAVVLTRAADTLPLPGLPGHALLAAGSDVLAAATRLSDGCVYTSFLCPHPAGEVVPGYLRVTVLTCPPQFPYHLVAVVLLSPSGELSGLTRRELEIVGLLVDGWSNPRIAAALFVTERTVATHVEHILVKLGAATRTLAAVRALRCGLYVPRPLNGVRA